MTSSCYTLDMGFTPPPEKLSTFKDSAVLTESFLAPLRGASMDAGAVRFADGTNHWPTIDVEGHWTWTRTPGVQVTPSTFRLLAGGVLQADGTIFVVIGGSAARCWLCDVELCDRTRFALPVSA